MKILENKHFTIGNAQSNYADLVKACVANIDPKHGVNLEEMRKRLRILEAVEKGDDNLGFEDADVSVLKKLVTEMAWAVVDKNIVSFCDEVTSL